MKCILCNKEIIGYGNNARPLAKGVCCDDCNFEKVIPERLKEPKLCNIQGCDEKLVYCKNGWVCPKHDWELLQK